MDPTDNLLLAALPAEERNELLGRMHSQELKLGDVLYEQDQRVANLYFPLSGAVSLIIMLEDGRSMEPAIIGREGMLGFPIGLGDDFSRWQSLVQIAGESLVVPRHEVREHLLHGGRLGPVLTHYAGLLVTFTAQSAVCAQFHSLEERTARWLLLMGDRAIGDEFVMTHDHLATMLGALRPSETNTLNVLKDRGAIELRRGHIRIIDRTGLESAACECYKRVDWDYREDIDQPV